MARSVHITRVYHFSAAHQLASAALSPSENVALYGACHRPHGHNYYLEVTVAGTPDARTGMAVDLAELEDAPALAGVITTGESLARAFWRALAPGLPTGQLSRITVVETAKNRFEYQGEAA